MKYDSNDSLRSVDKVVQRIQSSIEVCEEYHNRANRNGIIVSPLNSSWSKEDIRKMKERDAPTLNLPYARLLLASLSGREILDRINPVPKPFEEGDGKWAEKLSYYLRFDRGNDAKRIESDSFRSSLNCGVGVYSCITDLNRWIPKSKWKYRRVYDTYWDINSEDRNFRDRIWDVTVGRFRKDEFKFHWPQHYDKVKNSNSGILDETDSSFGMHSARRRPKIYRNKGEGNQRRKDYDVEVIFYEERERREVVLVDYGSYFVKYGMKEFALKFVERNGGSFDIDSNLKWRVINDEVFTYKLIANKIILEEGRIKENGFVNNFITGFRSETKDKTRWHGVTDLSVDTQKLLDKFASMWLYDYATQPKNTYISKSGVVTNIQEAEDKIAKGGIIEANSDADLSEVFVPLKKGSFPDASGGMSVVRQIMFDVGGVDPYSLGQVGSTGSLSRTSSKTVSQVSESGTALVAEPFDNYAASREDASRLQFGKMIAYLDEEKLAKIVGKKRSLQVVPEDGSIVSSIPSKEEWQTVLEYDISMDFQPSTSTEKQAMWDSLNQHGGIQYVMQYFPEMMIDFMPNIPESKKEYMRARMQQQMEAQQNQQPDQQIS